MTSRKDDCSAIEGVCHRWRGRKRDCFFATRFDRKAVSL